MKAFANLHPAVQLFWFLSVLAVAMFSGNPVLSVTALLGGILFCLVLVKRSRVPGDLGLYIPLFFLVAVTNPLLSHNGVTPLFFLNGKPVTLEALLYGVFLAVTVVGVMLWCKCYSEVMTCDRFLYLFGRVIPKLALVLSMALRFVPLFRRQMRKVRDAQKTMGFYAGRGFADRIRSAGRVFLSVIAWSLENAMETASSMKARGYGGAKRTTFSLFRFSARDGVLLAVGAGLVSLTVFGMASGAAAFSFYPRVGTLQLTPAAFATELAFFALTFCPFAMEVKEVAVWNCCRSKI